MDKILNEKNIRMLMAAVIGALISLFFANRAYKQRIKIADNTIEILKKAENERDSIFKNIRKPDEKVILLGSGTVMNFLIKRLNKDSKGKALLETFHMLSGPSETGLDILMSSNKQSLPLISMSSTIFNSTNIENKQKKYNVKKPLYYYYLGRDELLISFRLTTDSKIKDSPFINRGLMRLDELYQLLNNKSNEFDLYVTNPNSGTRIEFEKALKEINPNFRIDDITIKGHYNSKSSHQINGTKKDIVILHSQEYDFTSDEFTPFKIYNEDAKEFAHKDLCLYILDDKYLELENRTLSISDNRGDFFQELIQYLNSEKISNWEIEEESVNKNSIQFYPK